MALALLATLTGAVGTTVFLRSQHSGTVSSSAPAAAAPATLAPSAAPTPTPATPAPRTGTLPTYDRMTVGLVNIDTVLGLQGAQAAGSGIVLSSSGEILTNNHVVQGATKITVTVVATGKSYIGNVVGTDPSDDIAVVQLSDASGLATAPLGRSAAVRVGDAVVGIGNAGGTGTPTTATGTVLALDQTITATDESGGNAETLHGLIQTSAALQPGQSGGPLYDTSGTVIGVDSAASMGGGRYQVRGKGQGFAIPIDAAMDIVHQIEAGKPTDKITIGTPALLGVSATDGSGTTAGAVVESISAGSPAAQAGLRAGDVIVSLGSTRIDGVSSLVAAVRAHKAGDKVTVTYQRNGTTRTTTATLVAGPAN